MSLTYTTYTAQLANLLAYTSTEASWTTFLPGCIDYAEQRIYRETDLLATRVTDQTGALSSGVRTFSLPTSVGTYLVVENVNLITPSNGTFATGTRVPLVFTSKEFIDVVYPSAASSNCSTPEFCAMVNNATLSLGPAPDTGYPVEVIGTQRPTPLSVSNSSTIITQMLPDLFIAASMVFGTGFQRDFGSMADDPSRAQSWESQYKMLFASANIEELRKRYMGPAWAPMTPSPVATPARV